MSYFMTMVRCVLTCAAVLVSLTTASAQGAGRLGRPGPADQPLSISVGAYLIDVIEIDDVAGTFTVDFLVDLRWKDPKLVDPSSAAQRRLALDQAWHPELAFVNERSITPKLEPYLIVDSDGSVRYLQRYFGTFSVALQLQDFPFDEQTLSIDMVVLRYRPDEIVCVPNQGVIGRESIIDLSGWHIERFTVTPGVKKVGMTGFDLAASFLRVEVRRERAFYMWKIVFPLVLIVFMAAAVFWIPPTLIPSQIGIATASVLTLIAFYLTISNYLPRISYLTRLDIFVVGCTAIVFLAFGQAVLTGKLAHSKRVELAQKIDRRTRLVFFAVFAALVLYAFVF